MQHTAPSVQTLTTGFVVAVVGFFSSFPIVLEGLRAVGASHAEAASGLMAAAISMGLAGIVLSLVSREPVSVAWSTPGAALLAISIAPDGGFGAAIGAFLVAAALVILSGLFRPLGQLATRLPAPLAQAMLAGVLLPLCLTPFRALAIEPSFVVPIFATWILTYQVSRLFAVPAAVLVTALLILILADTSSLPETAIFSAPVLTTPSFSLSAAIGLGLPLFIVTMATQNVPGLAILRGHDFGQNPAPLLTGVGLFSALSAPFGAHSTCLAAITAEMCANPESHPDPKRRYWSAVFAGAFYCLFGLLAGWLTSFAALAPPLVVASLAGLALANVMAGATVAALTPPDSRDAALVTFLITASGVTILGLGGAVWGLLIGGAIYALKALR